MCGPTQRRIAQGGNPASLKLEAGWVEVALARCQFGDNLEPEDLDDDYSSDDAVTVDTDML